MRTAYLLFLVLVCCTSTQAHDWHSHLADAYRYQESRVDSAALDNEQVLLVATKANAKPKVAKHFEHFKNVKMRWDANILYVESNGLPEHNMMVGIRAWQQQVPLPQPFQGQNSWKIPLKPRLALDPINAKETSFRGAIAVAVNGVPIFSALNNRGVDAYLAGELDKWGGHCGRGDDYHYHTAPIHLEPIIGKGNPIAFALDGFPIYGLTEADGSAVGKLDALNGQFDADGNYHYHATKTYPYINGGIRGIVDYRNGEIASQPRDSPIRPAQRPLRDAKITDFKVNGKQSVLTYEVQGKKGTIAYSPVGRDSFKFTYTQPSGQTWSETYQRRSRDARREPDQGGRDQRRPPPPRGDPRPPRR